MLFTELQHRVCVRFNVITVVNAKLAIDRYVALGSLTDLPTLRSNLLSSADYLMSNVRSYRLKSIAVTCSCYSASVSLF
jgi:hypothetical protein